MPDDRRDEYRPKHPRASTDAAVPPKLDDDVTGRHFLTPEDEGAARFQRDVKRGLRAVSLKIAAGNKVFRDELRASRAERDRRIAAEVDQRQRRDAYRKLLLTKVAPIIAAITGLVTAIAALKGKLP